MHFFLIVSHLIVRMINNGENNGTILQLYIIQIVVFHLVISFTLTKCQLISPPPPVSRLHCESESFKMDLILDVNIQIYPVDLGRLPLICVHF